LIAERWSPYAFADRPVPAEDLRSLFEAARWAASSYNEQPWSYLVATRAEPEQYERVHSCLVEGNTLECAMRIATVGWTGRTTTGRSC
jgi:nitroreductase